MRTAILAALVLVAATAAYAQYGGHGTAEGRYIHIYVLLRVYTVLLRLIYLCPEHNSDLILGFCCT